jgi:hypothetical protein
MHASAGLTISNTITVDIITGTPLLSIIFSCSKLTVSLFVDTFFNCLKQGKKQCNPGSFSILVNRPHCNITFDSFGFTTKCQKMILQQI